MDPEVALAVSYAPPARRVALTALFALDARLAAIVRAARDPMVAQLRLTWWHEALGRLDTAPPPAEPVLRTLAAELIPAGVTGARLATMIDGWERLLDEPPLSLEQLDGFARERGGGLFGIAGALLGAGDPAWLAAGGEGWALAELARRLPDPADRQAALTAAAARFAAPAEPRWPPALRPLGALVMLARQDVRRGASRLLPSGAPSRVARMAWHRATGR